jgi:hypothetical protein
MTASDAAVSNAEKSVARLMRAVLKDIPVAEGVGYSEALQELCNALEWFIIEVLTERHPHWERDEALDGVLPAVVRKTGPEEILLSGHSILISDQTVTPLHLRMQLDPTRDEVSWFECRIGQQVDGHLKRIPYDSYSNKQIIAAVDQPDVIEWSYKVTYGERRH